MKNLEQWLKDRPLAEPSEALDRRVDQMLAQAPAPRRGVLAQPVALWQSIAACLVFTLVGYLLHGQQAPPAEAPPPPAPTKIYVLQTDQMGSAAAFQIAPGRTISVSGCIEAQVEVAEEPEIQAEPFAGSI
jgi:hypothetical protein